MSTTIQVGDYVTRYPINYDEWWRDLCRAKNIPVDSVLQVEWASNNEIRLVGWKFRVNKHRFYHVKQGDPIQMRIKKLYSKCKTTTHWSK